LLETANLNEKEKGRNGLNKKEKKTSKKWRLYGLTSFELLQHI
jgi:hypothetical protein